MDTPLKMSAHASPSGKAEAAFASTTGSKAEAAFASPSGKMAKRGAVITDVAVFSPPTSPFDRADIVASMALSAAVERVVSSESAQPQSLDLLLASTADSSSLCTAVELGDAPTSLLVALSAFNDWSAAPAAATAARPFSSAAATIQQQWRGAHARRRALRLQASRAELLAKQAQLEAARGHHARTDRVDDILGQPAGASPAGPTRRWVAVDGSLLTPRLGMGCGVSSEGGAGVAYSASAEESARDDRLEELGEGERLVARLGVLADLDDDVPLLDRVRVLVGALHLLLDGLLGRDGNGRRVAIAVVRLWLHDERDRKSVV
jgi:hypothetical protein